MVFYAVGIGKNHNWDVNIGIGVAFGPSTEFSLVHVQFAIFMERYIQVHDIHDVGRRVVVLLIGV